MQCVNHVLEIQTRAEREFHDITPQLRELISGSEIQQGWVVISAMHTTCAVIVNENEPRLLEDIKKVALCEIEWVDSCPSLFRSS